MSEELDVLKQVATALDRAQINYMLTGSLASNYYSIPRMTRDIDLILEMKQEHLPLCLKAFKDDFYIDENMVEDAVRRQNQFNLIHNKTLIKVDMIIRKNSTYRETEFARKKKVQIDGFKVWLVAAEDLVLSKLFWAKDSLSDKQLTDVKNILDVQKDLDHDYIRHWVDELGLATVFGQIHL